jgi:ribosomal protein uL24
MKHKDYSSKPNKVRKRMYTAPQHKRRKQLTARLIESLRDKHGISKTSIRKGDSVLITRGDFSDIEGKVESVDYKTCRITVEGVDREKADGSRILMKIPPSTVMITKLQTDKRRRLSGEEEGGSK